MKNFAIAVVGPDRPGIVAAVSAALQTLDCNLEDVTTSVLRGHFSMMLVVATPDGMGQSRLQAELDRLGGDGIAAAVWPVDQAHEGVEATQVLNVYGPDKTGIVHAVSALLAGLGVNITDMVCRLHDGDPAIYVVTVELVVPDDVDAGALSEQLRTACGELGLDFSLTAILRADL